MTRKLLLGRHFSEGARRLWLIMRWRAWSQKDLAEALGKHSSVINRWLYGEQSPAPPLTWRHHPERPFIVLQSVGGSV